MDAIEQALQRTLVVRCQLGEHRALEELFLHHNRALGYYMRRLLNRDGIEDIQQEVWLTVLRRIGQLRNPDAFVVWLYRIARNKVVARFSDPQQALSLDDVPDKEELVDSSEPEFSASEAARIHEELGRLSVKHREVLLLRFIEDLSYDQIAEVIGCTAGTVRSRLHYAKLALRQQLEQTPCPNLNSEPFYSSKTVPPTSQPN